MSSLGFFSLTVNLCVPLEHVVVSALSGLSGFFDSVVRRLLYSHGLPKFAAALGVLAGC